VKASICMSIYNKNDFLPNVFYSLSKQKISFPFEVCIVDDHSDIDPYPLVEEFLVQKGISVKYNRFSEYRGFMYAYDTALKMSSEDCNCMILQSADVIYLEENIIQQLCTNLSPSFITLLEVYNIQIEKNFYQHFEENKNFVLKHWNDYKKIAQQLLYYEGLKRKTSWFFFLGGILKKDLNKNYSTCDMLFNQKLHKNHIRPRFLNLHAIHQNHRHQHYVCPLIKTCGMCSRTRKKKIRRQKNA
jgi:hypothetical protein